MKPLLLLLASIAYAQICQDGADAARRRDFPAAEKLLERCIHSPDPPLDAFLILCGVYQARQNPDALARTATEGIRRFPQEKRFYLSAGTIAGRQRKYAEAVAILEPANKNWPDDDKLRSLLGSSYLGRGTEALDNGKNEEAAGYLRRAIELSPGDVEAYVNLGRALHNLLQHSAANAAFDKVVELQPTFPLVQFHLGHSLYSLGEFDKAISAMNQQIAADPAYPPAYLIRGLARLAKGESAEAAPDLEKAAAEMPRDANAQMSCARMLIQLGRDQDAEAKLRRAMELDPSNPAPVNSLVSVLIRLDRGEEARVLARHAAVLARNRRSVSEGEIRFEKAGK